MEFRFPEISEETLKRCINSDSFADSLEISHAIYKMLSALCREYGIDITAAVRQDNVWGCQFHPEKSGKVGLAILKAFCEI